MVRLFLSGLLISAPFVLPGMSLSGTLLLLQGFDTTLEAIHTFNFAYLVPLGAGLLIGTLLVTKLIEKALENFNRASYLIITGFIIASIRQIATDVFTKYTFEHKYTAICVAMFAAGGLVTFCLGKKTAANNN
jgi:uncharacterized membrane protein